jgi:hypothetical protein
MSDEQPTLDGHKLEKGEVLLSATWGNQAQNGIWEYKGETHMTDIKVPAFEMLWMYRRDENGQYIPLTAEELRVELAHLPEKHKWEREQMNFAHNAAAIQLGMEQENEARRIIAAIKSLEQSHE